MNMAFTAGSTAPTMTASMTAQVRHLQTLITSYWLHRQHHQDV